MYRRKTGEQLSLFRQEATVMEVLDKDDEIYKLAQSIDWDYIDELYAKHFESSSKRGNQNAISSRVAFGALFVKQYLGLSDRDTYLEIKRNPYWQFFLGLPAFTNNLPFQPSYMTAFRQRFPEDVMEMINEHHADTILQKNERRS